MIRTVVVGRVRPGTDPALARTALDAIVALPVGGPVDVRNGPDAGLRAGAWSFAVAGGLVDAEACRVSDADAGHTRLRREPFDPIWEDIARVQVEA